MRVALSGVARGRGTPTLVALTIVLIRTCLHGGERGSLDKRLI